MRSAVDTDSESHMSWSAGVARRTITPDGKDVWLAGYGHRSSRSQGKLHDIAIRALAFAHSDGSKALLLTVDLCFIATSTVRNVRAGIPAELLPMRPGALRIIASHTHSGPCCSWQLGKPSPAVDFDSPGVPEELLAYTRSVEAKMIEAAVESLSVDKMHPVDLVHGRSCGQVTFAMNRRNDKEIKLTPVDLVHGRSCGQVTFAMNRRNDKEIKLTAEEASCCLQRQQACKEHILPPPYDVTALVGPHDHTTDVLHVVLRTGVTLAVVFGYPCHATVLDTNVISNDWVGFAQSELETQLLPGCLALFATGCGGDQNPGTRRHVDLAKLWGLQMARAVAQICKRDSDAKIRDSDAKIHQIVPESLHTTAQAIALPFARLPTEAELDEAATGEAWCPTLLPADADPGKVEKLNATTNASFAHLISGARKQWANLMRKRLYSGNREDAAYSEMSEDYEVSCWQFGHSLTWYALAGEPTVEYALRLRETECKDARAVLTSGYTNGSPGYIPSERVLKEGGYEGGESMCWHGSPSRWADGIESRILAACAEALEDVRRQRLAGSEADEGQE
eukprot:gnl/TRDRNA2_/TRDRNA2_92482_c0_seq1.p1 gnl/TRDRNA2_/TRDRNA2_92482_c0~~gnl/TRDRNA2_/TRDRNA2_92482_c0_seq1.p1  ORF type:complete len:566 (-),score=68.48 gnl/TRDRNA2_/TRDRNA2_92482_c0_seq1:57-1754(-)